MMMMMMLMMMMMPLLLASTAPSTLPPHRNANEVRARRPDHGDVDRLQLFGKTWQKGRLGCMMGAGATKHEYQPPAAPALNHPKVSS